MSSSIGPLFLIVDVVAGLIGVAFCSLTALNAFRLTRVLVSSIYRRRALWTGVAAVLIIGWLLDDVLVAVNAPAPPLGYVLPGLGVVASVALAYRTVGVAIDRDYFRRDSLHWSAFGKVAMGATVGLIGADWVLQFSVGLDIEQSPEALAILGPVIAYITATLVLSSKRTADRALRRYVLLLGLAFAMGAVATLDLQLFFVCIAVGTFFLFLAAQTLAMTTRGDLGPKDVGLDGGGVRGGWSETEKGRGTSV